MASVGWVPAVLALCWIAAAAAPTTEPPEPQHAEVSLDEKQFQRVTDRMADAHRRLMSQTDVFGIYPPAAPLLEPQPPPADVGGMVVLYPEVAAAPGVVVLYPAPESPRAGDEPPPVEHEPETLKDDAAQVPTLSETVAAETTAPQTEESTTAPSATDIAGAEHPVADADTSASEDSPPVESEASSAEEVDIEADPSPEDEPAPSEGDTAAAEVQFEAEAEPTPAAALLVPEESAPQQLEALAPFEEYVAPAAAAGPPQTARAHNGRPQAGWGPRSMTKPAGLAGQRPAWPESYGRRRQSWSAPWARGPSTASPWPYGDRSAGRVLTARTAHPAPWRSAGRPPPGLWPWPAVYTSSGGRPAAVPSGGQFPLYSGWQGAGANYGRQYAGAGRFPLFSQWYRPAAAPIPGVDAGAGPFPTYQSWPRPAVAMATSEAISPDGQDGWQWPAVSMSHNGDQLVVTGGGHSSGAMARSAGNNDWPPAAVATAGSADGGAFSRSSSGGFNLFFHDDEFWTEPLESDGNTGPGGDLLSGFGGGGGQWTDWGGGLMAFTSPGEEYAPPMAVRARSGDGDEAEGEEAPDVVWDGSVLLAGSWPEPEGSGAPPLRMDEEAPQLALTAAETDADAGDAGSEDAELTAGESESSSQEADSSSEDEDTPEQSPVKSDATQSAAFVDKADDDESPEEEQQS